MHDSIHPHSSIAAFDANAWDALAGHDPFTSHAFLNAMEASGCVAPDTGWQPAHLGMVENGTLVGAMPLYLKSHSFGEYVFDWAWANAYQQNGLAYFPKLVSAVPFSPVTGPRLLGNASVVPALASAATALAEDSGLSSAHCLFPTSDDAQALENEGWLIRTDCQYHWHNRGYRDFDDFLATFRSSKRKKLRRERRRVAEEGIGFRVFHGDELDDRLLDDVYRFYCLTYFERGQSPYLNREFFETVAARLGRALVIFVAERNDIPIAAAICFRSADTLYGRHWGADQHWHSLHFETCYYQGIDYCIRHGLSFFDPGAQGQHKLSRGFEPTRTLSAHWIVQPDFRAAIADHLERERPLVEHYIDDAREHLPYK